MEYKEKIIQNLLSYFGEEKVMEVYGWEQIYGMIRHSNADTSSSSFSSSFYSKKIAIDFFECIEFIRAFGDFGTVFWPYP